MEPWHAAKYIGILKVLREVHRVIRSVQVKGSEYQPYIYRQSYTAWECHINLIASISLITFIRLVRSAAAYKWCIRGGKKLTDLTALQAS